MSLQTACGGGDDAGGGRGAGGVGGGEGGGVLVGADSSSPAGIIRPLSTPLSTPLCVTTPPPSLALTPPPLSTTQRRTALYTQDKDGVREVCLPLSDRDLDRDLNRDKDSGVDSDLQHLQHQRLEGWSNLHTLGKCLFVTQWEHSYNILY